LNERSRIQSTREAAVVKFVTGVPGVAWNPKSAAAWR
jgi:hypothetical protein